MTYKTKTLNVPHNFSLDEFFCQGLRIENIDPRNSTLTELHTPDLRTVRPLWEKKKPPGLGVRLGVQAFKTCWLEREHLPQMLRQNRQVYFDGDLLLNQFNRPMAFYLRWTKQDWNKENSPMDWRWGICSITYDWGNDFQALVV